MTARPPPSSVPALPYPQPDHRATPIPLTLLYSPADRPDRVQRALDGDADVVIVDLEDAVAPARKDEARAVLKDLALPDGPTAQVRINAPGTRWHTDDLVAIRSLPAGIGVRLPKCESPQMVREVAGAIGDRPLHLLLESALGVERAFELAGCHHTVASIALGEADLLADLRALDPAALGWARGRILIAASAAGLPSPTMSVYTDHRDLDGLRRTCQAGRRLGFLGRTAIHPAQLPVIRDAFRPSESEIATARAMVAAADEGIRVGRGAVALPSGAFVDVAVLRQAAAVMALAARYDTG